jgi:hypothetical protein
MKPAPMFVSFAIGIVIGVLVGFFFAWQQARVAIIGGPDSDNYP